MTQTNLLDPLRYLERFFPFEAVKKAEASQETITPLLLDELEALATNPQKRKEIENPKYMLHLYTLFLLSSFQEKRAFKKILALLSLDSDYIDTLLGDFLTEGLVSVLYSTYDGNLTALETFISNPEPNFYARDAALQVYGKLYADGLIEKERCIRFLRSLLTEEEKDGYDIANSVMQVVRDRHLFEMVDDIQELCDADRIDLFIAGGFDDFIDDIYDYRDDHEPVKIIEDVTSELSTWACFERTPEQKKEHQAKMKTLEKELRTGKRKQKETAHRQQKVGRNDPCPCGSGKKYKKCCLIKEQTSPWTETALEQAKLLRNYPVSEGKKQAEEVRITDIFNSEAIAIDRLVYLALHRYGSPIFASKPGEKETAVMLEYLLSAYQQFTEKCAKENIKTFSDYDQKHKIHYRSSEWLHSLLALLKESRMDQYQGKAKEVQETLTAFS